MMQQVLDFTDRPRRQFVHRSPEEVRAEAQEMLDVWGAFVAGKKTVRKLVQTERDLTVGEGRHLSALIRETGLKLITMNSIPVGGGVDWPDHHVAHVIRTMTKLDDDRAETLNHLGWGQEASSKGHYCNAMLAIDRARGIAVGRLIVEHYRKQTESVAGIYALPHDWVMSK